MKSMLHKTQNDLAKSVREPVIRLLNERLASTIDLALQAKQAHWNVKGANFIPLHELFDEIAESLHELSDELAERAVSLGGTAYGTVQVIARDSHLPAYSLELSLGCDHVQALTAALAQFGKSVRSAITAADELGDAGTADLFTQASRTVDKLLWKLEAHQCG
jgi:starvation-inducible DNA-binding protein